MLGAAKANVTIANRRSVWQRIVEIVMENKAEVVWEYGLSAWFIDGSCFVEEIRMRMFMGRQEWRVADVKYKH
jgi:hypothetical protein